MRSIHDYEDIIDMPRPEPKNHVRMPAADRAAQFAPFAALTGYNAVIEETARETEARTTLDESEKLKINRTIERLQRCLKEGPFAEITFFQQDRKKAGGRYETVKGMIKKIEEYQRQIIMENGTKISFQDIIHIRRID